MDWMHICNVSLTIAMGVGVLGLIYVVLEIVRIDDVRIEL